MMKGRLWFEAAFALAALLAGTGARATTGLPAPPIPAFSPEAQAQREATSLRKEGDRQQEAGNLKEAREKWLAALDAYRRSGYKAGEPEVLFRLGASYQAEAAMDVQKQKLVLTYTIQALLASSEFLESVLKEGEPAEPGSFQRADALLKQASDLAATGNCGEAAPLFSQAGEASGKAGWAKGEARSLAGRLRCLLKSEDLSVLMMGMMSGMTEFPALFQKLKPQIQPGPTVRYLKAIEDDQLANWKDAESEYRTALQEAQTAGDSLIVARIELDLGGVLARIGNLAEAETLFRSAGEGFAVLPGPDSRRNQAAAIQNLAGVNLATGRIDAAITAYREALELWKPLDDKPREAEALRAMSSALRQKGDDASANAALAEAKTLEERPVAKPQAGGAPGGTGEEDQGQGATQRPQKPPASVALTEGVIFTLSPRAQAQREAALLLGEGDRLLQAGKLRQAREKWQASAEAFKRAANRQGVAKCYKRLADSYAGGAMFDKEKRLLVADFYSRAMTELANEAEEDRRRKDSHLDSEELKKAGSLLDEATRLIDLEDCAKALPMLAEARHLYQRIGLAYGEVLSLQLRGRCEAIRGDLGSTLATSMEGLSILLALPVSAPASELILKAGDLLSLGRQAEALALYQEVFCRYERANDIGGMADTLRELGAVQLSMGDFAEAELSLTRALSLLPSVADEDRSHEAAIHHNLGAVYATTGRSGDAVGELRLALSLWRDLGDPEMEVVSLSALGVALSDQGDFPAAMAALDEAEKLHGKLSPNPELEGDLANNRGKVYRSQGRYQQALDSFRKAEALYRPLPVRLKEAQSLNNIGTIEEALGDFSNARSSYRQSREIARQLGATNLEIKVELNEANTSFESGEYQEAIRIYLDLLPISAGEAQVLMSIHNGLGDAYLRVGELEKVDLQLTQALDAAHELGNREGEASALTNRSQFRFNAGHDDLAKADNQGALKIWRDLGNEVMVSRLLGNLGWQAISRELSEEDLQVFKMGLESSRKAGLAADSLRFSLLLGAGCLQRGDLVGAIEQASQALAEADRIGDSVGQFVGRTMLMESHYLQGDPSAALRDLDAAVAGLDRWQSSLALSEFKSSFLAQPLFFETYALGVLLNAETGRPAEAFHYAEEARARAFLDQVGNQRIASRHGVETELIQEEGELRAQLAYLGEAIQKERRVQEPKQERLASLGKALEASQKDYDVLLSRLKLANPEYSALVDVRSLSLSEVQQQALDDQTTLVEYFVPDPPQKQDGSSHVLAWVIDRDRFTMVQLPVTSSQVYKQITYIRNLIATPNSVQTEESELFRELFAPLAPHVRHSNLIIVPHGVLHSLPFVALWDEANRRYLGDAYALSYAPSATVLKFARAKKARAVGPVLVAGNPDGSLPHAAAEAEAVARLYGGEPLLGRAATKSAVVAGAGQAGILHLAAHADLNQVNPLFTRLKLAPDGDQGGDLEMHEVFGLDLSRTGLVVLSACQTQQGKLSAGDELEGLTRAFLYAGTPAVLSSLWNVEDDSTAFLMTRFYTHLRQGAGRAESLRLAQIETRKRFPHPYQWAAFVLTGDGR
jgi:CHAT domain-containing protein/Tfp pilus assembly protein PilF